MSHPSNLRNIGRSRGESGRRGEAIVARYLAERGFDVLGRNIRVGRLELDVVARRGDLIVVCEVRARTSDRFVDPAATIDPRKVTRVRRAAAEWLASQDFGHVSIRFDAAAVVLGQPGARLDYYEDAF